MMTTTTRSTVVGVFEDRDRAEQAVDALRQAGFKADQVGFAGHGAQGDKAEGLSDDRAENITSGAVAGIVPGGLIGGLLGAVAAGLIPGVGPVIGAGILAGTLGGAAAGAAAGGILGALTGLGIPEDEAQYYEGEFQSGRSLVTVKAEGRYDEAQNILQQYGAYDINTAPGRSGTIGSTTGSTRTDESRERVEMRGEEIRPRVDNVQTGEARITKDVVEEQRTVEVPTTREEVTIERRPVQGQPPASGGVGQGDEIRVPIHEDQVEVDKETVVTEEVEVKKQQVPETRTVEETVRREEPRIDRSNT